MSDAMPVLIDRNTARAGATGIAALRVAIGAAAVVAPRFALRPWVGSSLMSMGSSPMIGRSIGGRDLALGVGALIAMREDGPARGWIEAGLLADSFDAVGMVLGFSKLPAETRWAILALTLGAVAAGAVIAPAIDHKGG